MADLLRHHVTVKQLTRLLKMKLESEPMLQDIWVQGEISNFTHHSSGHMYFTLKDEDSKLKCVMFSSQNQRIKFIPRNGALVLAKGSITVYEKDGQYQFMLSDMQPDGLGSLHVAFEQLKQKLEKEGLFEAKRKKPLPSYPQAIGVITSPTGAAVRDIITTLQRRYPAVYILIYPVHVQGDVAAASIAKAIDRMNQLADVKLDLLIVGRGGGSIEELWAFNEEIVARSIAASRIPIISAVGHETDFTIADFVADVRAATPTAAAELAVPYVPELLQRLESLSQRMRNIVFHKVKQSRSTYEQLMRSPVMVNPHRWLHVQSNQRLDRAIEAMKYVTKQQLAQSTERWSKLHRKIEMFHPAMQVEQIKRRTSSASQLLHKNFTYLLQGKTQSWQLAIRQLDALSPLKVMQRGYSLVYDTTGKQVIRSVSQVTSGDSLHIKVKDGRIKATVVAKEEDHND